MQDIFFTSKNRLSTMLSRRFKHFIFILGLGGLSFSISCGDKIDIPNTPLAGKIDGQDWEFKFGNAYIFSGGQIPEYTFRLLSTSELGNDPCPIVSTTKAHLKMVLPLGTGSYSIPFSDFNETVKFDYGNGTVLAATSGFVEIFAIDQNQLIGYIQAVLDDDNIVEGRFVIEIC